MKVLVIILSLVFVLQVLCDEESQPRLDCGSLCEQVDSGLAGICCGKMKSENVENIVILWLELTGHEYCDCDSGSDIALECPPEEVFCDKISQYS